MIHLTPQQLSSYMDGELNEVSTELVRRHMEVCEECTLKFAALEVQEEQLSLALVHEPGDEFFDRFAAEVERQLPPPTKEFASKRGSSSPAGRAAALREAARDAAREAGRDAAFEVGRETETPFPAAEVEIHRPSAAPQPVPAAKPQSAIPPAAEEDDFDEESAMTELLADRPSDARLSDARLSDAPPSTLKPPPARPPVQEPVTRPPERKAPPPTAPMSRTQPAVQRRPQPPVQRRPKIRRPAPSVPWYAAMILALMAGAAGVVVSRTNPISAWLDSHVPRIVIPNFGKPTGDLDLPVTPTQEGAATQGVEGTSPSKEATPSGKETTPGEAARSGDEGRPDESETSEQDFFEPEPQAAEQFLKAASGSRSRAAAGAKDPFAGLLPSSLAQVRAAQRTKSAADAAPSAAGYEAAADEWERTIPLLRNARQQSLGRLELASSRYRAWENEPTQERAASAAVAIRTYLALAPQGAPRELMRNWLARVSQ